MNRRQFIGSAALSVMGACGLSTACHPEDRSGAREPLGEQVNAAYCLYEPLWFKPGTSIEFPLDISGQTASCCGISCDFFDGYGYVLVPTFDIYHEADTQEECVRGFLAKVEKYAIDLLSHCGSRTGCYLGYASLEVLAKRAGQDFCTGNHQPRVKYYCKDDRFWAVDASRQALMMPFRQECSLFTLRDGVFIASTNVGFAVLDGLAVRTGRILN